MSDTFDIAGFVFPIFSALQKPDHLAIDRFLGTGFWVSSSGHFLTCRHVLDALSENQVPVIGQPYEERNDHFIPIVETRSHPTFDMALGRAAGQRPRPFLKKHDGPIGIGLDVEAFAFMNQEKRGSTLGLDARLLRGHVSRMYSEPDGLPAKSIFEVSFASPSGFSGSPLLVGHAVVGMLYGNIESRLQAFAIEEVKDGNREYRETSYRVLEYGLAHPLLDLIGFTRACGVEPFA